jgi:hypothetical protein
MRVLLVLLLALAAGCGDDDTAGSADLSAASDAGLGRDLGPGDLACGLRVFSGLAPPATPEKLECPCGCLVDALDGSTVSPLWGASHSTGAAFVPMPGVGHGVKLTSDGGLELGSQASEGLPGSQFFLDGNFDLRVDYDLGATPPPGRANLVLGVRAPGTLSGTMQYEVRRQQLADGGNGYAARLGGVPDVVVPTTATHGTLRLTRQGYMVTAYADGQQITTLIAQYAGRLVITLAATLEGCTVADAGASCGYTPRWRQLVLTSGTLINQP